MLTQITLTVDQLIGLRMALKSRLEMCQRFADHNGSDAAYWIESVDEAKALLDGPLSLDAERTWRDEETV